LHLHTCVYIVCTIFILLPLCPPPCPSQWCQAPLPLYSPFLQFCRRNMKGKMRSMTFLLVWDKHRKFTYVVSMDICITAPIWFTSFSPLHSSVVHFPWWPNQFKISIFIPVAWAHKTH
jgi:hypothetical protein